MSGEFLLGIGWCEIGWYNYDETIKLCRRNEDIEILDWEGGTLQDRLDEYEQDKILYGDLLPWDREWVIDGWWIETQRLKQIGWEISDEEFDLMLRSYDERSTQTRAA